MTAHHRRPLGVRRRPFLRLRPKGFDGIEEAAALVAITSVVLTMLYGQTRVAFSMCRDGLLPERLAEVWERTRTPVILTLVFAVPAAALAAFVPLCAFT